MTEVSVHMPYEPAGHPDQHVDLNDQYQKFFADVIQLHLFDENEFSEDLLGFDDGTIKPLPANLDRHRCSSTSATNSREDPSFLHNVERSLLMSNAPGHGFTFEFDTGCEIQPNYGLYPEALLQDSRHELSTLKPPNNGNYDSEMRTPALSTPSSTLSDTSSLPTETPLPPPIQSYSPILYDASIDNFSYTHFAGYNNLHYNSLYNSPFGGATVSPKDLLKGGWESSDLCYNYTLPGDHNYNSPSPSTLTVPLPQHAQPDPIDYSAPTRVSIPSTHFQDGTVTISQTSGHTQHPTIKSLTTRSRLRSNTRSPSIAAAKVHSDSASNLRMSIPLPSQPSHSTGIRRETTYSRLQGLITARPSLSPGKRCRIMIVSDEEEDDEDWVLSNIPERNLKKHRKSTARKSNHRFFCSWPGCRAGFTRLYDQARHEVKHTGGGKEECRVCGEELSRKDSLNRHMAKKHKDMDHIVESDQDLEDSD
ncbi:hypothetical protein BDZ94DRAFT_1313203 [Collybia nuda]|uniref:C2H2-type domain-containing protein n=1 Tax=Collybia nuda TaxID=64659 RepID=A0A9P6CAM9_9AGAR|nr:hypothetical protein BDZ94DRAFT_1313203 [Collybia nuda]